MENASKALIMAGGMLIGILVLTLAVYLFSTFGTQASKVGDRVKEQQIEKFNSDYTSYIDKENITIYDVITVANRAKTYNEKNELVETDVDYYITVSLLNTSPQYQHLEKESDDKYKSLLEDDRNKINSLDLTSGNYLAIYTCSGNDIEYNTEGRVKKIVFKATP